MTKKKFLMTLSVLICLLVTGPYAFRQIAPFPLCCQSFQRVRFRIYRVSPDFSLSPGFKIECTDLILAKSSDGIELHIIGQRSCIEGHQL